MFSYGYKDNKIKQHKQIYFSLITDQIKALVAAAVADITTDIDSYNGLIINFKNVVELHHKYNVENVKLEKKLKDEIDDVSKNDRKTYYENQEIDNLKYYYTYFFMFIYAICIICFIIFGFIPFVGR
jgi:uncharacterized protein YgiM (DUF1202 family)